MMVALTALSAGWFAAFMIAAFVLAVVALAQSKATSVLAWACTIGFGALAWNALATT